MRDQFEKLPEIADSLSEHIYFGSDNLYHSALINFQGLVNWLNGAWYAFQEQQKKIDAIEKELEIRKQGASIMSWHREQILDMCESALRCSESIELNSVIGEIKEILK